ncbi:MAG: amino acid synthesis family protein, partial [Woeseiaceae bacterium]|nr:amino acid synthesis family protein [Woeseiaceae bacterium]
MTTKIRKIISIVEDTVREMDRVIDPVTRKAAAIAIIENPYAGEFVEDLEDLMHIGEDLGELLGRRAVNALGVSPDAIQSYGKAAVVGSAGELE